MAKFKLENIQIKTVEAGKQNAGNQYIVADAINVNCYWEQPQRFTSFLAPIVNMLKPLLPIANGGIAAEAKPIPEALEFIFGRFETYFPATDFYKRHLTDDPNGKWKAGDYVKAANGTPLVYPKETGIVVFVQYYMDEQGKEQMVRGMSLAEQGMRAFQAYCEPVAVASAATAPLQTTDATPQAPQAQPAAATGQAPAAPATQAATGTIVQIGTNPDGSPIYGPAPQ